MSNKINVSYVVQFHEGWDDWAYDKAYFTAWEAEARIERLKENFPEDHFRIVKRTEEVVDVDMVRSAGQ